MRRGTECDSCWRAPFFFCSLVSLQRGSAAPVSNKFARQRKDAEPQAVGAVQADFG